MKRIKKEFLPEILSANDGRKTADLSPILSELAELREEGQRQAEQREHAEPVKAPDGLPYMAGGCVVYTSDSRFRELSEYPLSLHDRTESQKLYDLLSE